MRYRGKRLSSTGPRDGPVRLRTIRSGRHFRQTKAANRPGTEETPEAILWAALSLAPDDGTTVPDLTAVPKTYQTYLDLGRFRNALILDAAMAHPTEGLTNFIATYRLQAYRPVE